jgi:UDP-glucuronate 4-epimerase
VVDGARRCRENIGGRDVLHDEKILITGPSGLVAEPIARSLARDNEVIGVARFRDAAARERLEAAGVTCLAVDLATSDLSEVPDDVTYVLNLAIVRSDDFDYDLAANGESTAFLMQRCRGVKAFLQCSSTAVYQPAGRHRLTETDPLGDSHRCFNATYSISKIAAETVARAACRMWQVPTVIARLNVPYGSNGGWPSMHLDAMLRGRPIPVHVDQPNVYNPIHEDDLIDQIPKLLAVASVPATVVNWAGPDQVSIEEWCAYMGELVGVTPQLAPTPDTLGSVTTDNTRMHELVGPARVGWRDGLRRMIEARHPELLDPGAQPMIGG